MPQLILPDVRLRRSFLAAMAEFAAEGRAGDDSTIGQELAGHGTRWDTQAGFADYVATVRADADEAAPRRDGFVPCTTWWWVHDNYYLGRVAIRHQLTDALRVVGGHIGYDIRRSARRQGHATAMLRAALPHAYALGIDPALITCRDDNEASIKVIEACGGIRDHTTTDQPTDTPATAGRIRHYWVPTAP